MIRLQAMSFGYGLRVGVTCVLGEYAQLSSVTDKPGCALTIPFLPSIAEFTVVAQTSGVEFCIIPLCSPYSHLGAATWFNDMPTMAIQRPWDLPDGTSVLADFDNGLLLVAESESDAEEIRKQVWQTSAIRPTHASDLSVSVRSQSEIAVLAEVTSASDMLRALADGADGLGVINAERIFRDVNGNNPEAGALISVVKANPHVLPVPVRFFDPDQKIEGNQGRIQMPHNSLGYRGVRVLEVDDTWFQRFVSGLEVLDLEQVVVILPMVTSASEVRRFRSRLGKKWNRVGVTVETPAAALRIKELLEVSTFIQIGLNDLTQYTMAWDRDVPNQERLPTDRIAEPVGDLVASVAAACTAAGVTYTLAMDLRPNEGLAAQVLQLGVTSVSCAPSLIKPWKYAIASQQSSG